MANKELENVTKTLPFDRRCTDRRRIDIGPPPSIGERRRDSRTAAAWSEGSCASTDAVEERSDPDRRRQDRRVGERRQVNLGPPPGIEERRFMPDPRGVVFLYVDEGF